MKWNRISPLVKLKTAKELVALSGVIELILGTYIGVRFGIGDTLQAWLFVGVLAILAYASTRLWIWVMEQLTKR